MATPEQAMNTALKMIERAAELLEAVDDRVGAARARHALAVIQYDAQFPESDEQMRVPLSLMRMALALMDKGGAGASLAACSLQHAIDQARGAPLGEIPNAALLALVETSIPQQRRLGRR